MKLIIILNLFLVVVYYISFLFDMLLISRKICIFFLLLKMPVDHAEILILVVPYET